jgi:hypothetical protein
MKVVDTIIANLIIWPGLLAWTYISVVVARARGFGSIWRGWTVYGEFIRIMGKESNHRLKQRYRVAQNVYRCCLVLACFLFVYIFVRNL